MRPTIFILFLFFVAKTFQVVSNFVFLQLFRNGQGDGYVNNLFYLVLIILLVYGLIKLLFPPKVFMFAGLALLPTVIIAFFITKSETLLLTFLSGFFLLLLINSEIGLLRELRKRARVSYWLTNILGIIPIAFTFFFPQFGGTVPILFYLVTTVFAEISAHSSDDEPDQGDKMPFVFAPLFLMFAGVLYAVAIYPSHGGAIDPKIIAFFMLFYCGGMVSLYIYMKDTLR